MSGTYFILFTQSKIFKWQNALMTLTGWLIHAFNKTPSKLQENQKYFIMVILRQANKQHIGTSKI